MKKPSVTVFVSAYNEAENIEAFLNSILGQKEENFILKKIVVVSDGSTDRTSEVVKGIHSSKIHLVDSQKRIGKSERLSAIYKTFQTDFLVQSDADIVMKDEFIISRLVKTLVSNRNIGLCGGNPIAVDGKTFTEKAINITHHMYRRFRSDLRKGHNVFSADGRLLALSKPFASGLVIPTDMIANDMFAYFSCISKGYLYRYVPEAVVWFRSPQNLRDHLRQNSRFEAGPIRMEKYFGKTLIQKELSIPPITLLTCMLKEFLQHPVLCLYILCANTLCRYEAHKKESKMTALWGMATTTKSLSLH